jgi:hypothetical protein
VIGTIGDADLAKQMLCTFCVLTAHAAQRQSREQHVLDGRTLRQQVVVLKDEADPFGAKAGQVRGRQRERIHVTEHDGSAAGTVQRAEDVEQRALSRPARAHDGEGFAGPHRERDGAQNHERLGRCRIILVQVGYAQREL